MMKSQLRYLKLGLNKSLVVRNTATVLDWIEQNFDIRV